MLTGEQENIFKQWFAEYEKLIFKVVRIYAESSADQEDLFQEILIHLWGSIPNFRGNAKATTWIYRVALNTALVWNRGETRRWKWHQRLLVGSGETSDTGRETCGYVQDDRILGQVYEAIRKLPKIDSSLLLMHLDGLSYDEMANILGISKNNVGVRLNRAKKCLAQLLKGVIDDL